jgi:hypothetical protein
MVNKWLVAVINVIILLMVKQYEASDAGGVKVNYGGIEFHWNNVDTLLMDVTDKEDSLK